MPSDSLPRLSSDHAELLVLAVLSEGESYGYALTKSIAARSDDSFSLGPAKLYPLLTKLEKQGLVTTSWEEVKAENSDDEKPGRKRKWYTLSTKGRRRLEQHVRAHRRFTALIEAFIPPTAGATA